MYFVFLCIFYIFGYFVTKKLPLGTTFKDVFTNCFLIQKSEKSGESDLEGQKQKGKVIKFGWIEGVYVSNI